MSRWFYIVAAVVLLANFVAVAWAAAVGNVTSLAINAAFAWVTVGIGWFGPLLYRERHERAEPHCFICGRPVERAGYMCDPCST